MPITGTPDKAHMNNGDNSHNLGSIALYKTTDGATELEVKLERDTVWLTQAQMGQLFDKDSNTISEHIQNVYSEKELSLKSTSRKFRVVQKEGERIIHRSVNHYNLDVIISVGYRVKSIRGTQFRVWSTNTLRNFLIQGYVINQKRLELQSEKLSELQKTIQFIEEKSQFIELKDQTSTLIRIIQEYSSSLSLLYQYDEGKFQKLKEGNPEFTLTYKECNLLIKQVKNSLTSKNEMTDLFGYEVDNKLKSILGALFQTFNRRELYPTIEDKASHLLYLIIKDHPLADGNKRTASILFVYYLERNNYLKNMNATRKIDNNTLFALALLIASSQPAEKDVMIQIIKQLLVNQ